MDFQNLLLICADCDRQFVFSAGEQLFFHDMQFTSAPKRCTPCKIRRSKVMGYVRGGPSGRVETHTHCSQCNQSTTVPFRPTQNRPVLCKGCFNRAKDEGCPAGQDSGMSMTAAAD